MIELVALILGADNMADLPMCDRLPGMCGAVLLSTDDAGTKRIHFCGMAATHASPDFRSPLHRCVCHETWTEATA